MEYGCPDKRKSKRDKRAKSRRGRYKRGGSMRSTKIKLTGKKDEKD